MVNRIWRPNQERHWNHKDTISKGEGLQPYNNSNHDRNNNKIPPKNIIKLLSPKSQFDILILLTFWGEIFKEAHPEINTTRIIYTD